MIVNRTSDRWCKQIFATNCTACEVQYYGEFCEYSIFEDDPIFVVFVLFYQLLFILAMLTFLIWNIVGLIFKIKNDPEIGCSSIALYVIYAVIAYCILRIVHYIDPYGLYLIIPPVYETSILWLGIMALNTGTVLLVALWFDIGISMEYLNEKKFFYTKIITLGLAGGFAVPSVLIIVILGMLMDSWGLATTLLDLLLIIVITFLGVMSFLVIPKVSKHIPNNNKRIYDVWCFIFGLYNRLCGC